MIGTVELGGQRDEVYDRGRSPAGPGLVEPGYSLAESTAQGQQNSSAFKSVNAPVTAKLCPYWKAGRCFRGDKCRFRHEDEVFVPPDA